MTEKYEKLEMKIDQLTEIVISGFERVDDRFEQVDKRFEQIDHRFDRLESRVEHTESGVETIKSTLTDHGKILHQLQGDVSMLVKDDLNHEKRIRRLEKITKPLAL
jgi:uncharacterized coiled-coil protein SlyX